MIIAYLYSQHSYILKNIPKSKKAIKTLYKKLDMQTNRRELLSIYLPTIISLLILIFLALMIHLHILYITILVFIFILISPLIIHWNFINFKNISDYQNLCIYLSQFILIFKNNHKIISTLYEMQDTMDKNTNQLINKMIFAIESGSDNQSALGIIGQVYPHFILHNLHSLVTSVEKYGSDNYYYALNLIQDDVDDWLEDLDTYFNLKRSLVRKINLLIAFAYLISFIAVKMLFSVSLDMNNFLYQKAIFTFFVIELMTYLFAQSLYNDNFIHKGEKTC